MSFFSHRSAPTSTTSHATSRSSRGARLETPFPTQGISISELPSLTASQLSVSEVMALEGPSGTHSLSLEELKSFLFEELIGTIQMLSFETLPANYLACEGQSLRIVEYPQLYGKIGTLYGDNSADASQFFLPDLRGYFLRGATSEVPLGTIQQDAMQKMTGAITKTLFDGGVSASNFSGPFSQSSPGSMLTKHNNTNDRDTWKYNIGDLHWDTSLSDARTADETRPKNVSMIFAIRAK